MRTVWGLLVVATVVIAGISSANAQANKPKTQVEFLTEMKIALKEEGLVGIVWTAVTPDGIATGAAGFANAERKKPLSANSRVQVGSITKTLVAAGVLRLVTEGRLTLDSPVAALLPQVQFENPWAPSHPVLVRHLLDHTSGLDDAGLWQVFSLNAKPDTSLSTNTQRGPLRIGTRPGSRLSYSNLGYTLLGMVIERVSNKPYERNLDTHLLHPLGMHQSTFRFVSQDGPHTDPLLAMGHFEGGATQPAVPMYLRPAGQFTTTASDMGLFVRFLMGNSEIDGEVFIAPHLLRAMGRPTTTEAVSAGLVDAGYGLGLNSRDRHGVRGNCHHGTTVGFRANFCLFPEQQKAFFVAFNADVEAANYARFDALLIDDLGITDAIPTKAAAPPSGISDWQGIYVLAPSRIGKFAYLDRVLNFATAQWDGQQLYLKPFQGSTISLTPVGGWLFRAEDRARASHVLLVSADSRRIISDGFRSYAQTSLWRMILLWASLLAGMFGLVYLIVFGAFRVLRRRLRRADPLSVPFLAAVALFLPIPFFFKQSFLQLGDLTPASALLALVTGMLPFAMLFGVWRSFSRDARDRSMLGDKLAMLGVLQWSMVLAFWGLVPLRLWV